MTMRSEREKSKMQEKYQLILAQMLKEEDNKYCVDCDTKSPRWASWNIGVFLCIRCAGFHRNLGVHISKVKSVNLDSWTAEQIAAMQAMGNSRARAVYEANLPDGFRRPQADSALETFIRAKYEQRKWIAKEWIPPEITVPIDLIDAEPNQQEKRPVETTSDLERAEKNSNTIPKLKPFAAPKSSSNPVRQTGGDRSTPSTLPSSSSAASLSTTPIPALSQPSSTEISHNLLSLDEPSLPVSSNKSTSSTGTPSADILDPLHSLFETTPAVSSPNTNGNTAIATSLSLDQALQNAFSPSTETTASSTSGGLMSNDKIMALFNSPQTSGGAVPGLNLRPPPMHPGNVSAPSFAYSQAQQHHLLHHHQKSASFGSNLYQQSNNFASRGGLPMQHGYPPPPRVGLSAMSHNPNGLSSPTLQSPASNFTQDQLNTQFGHLMPFANTKSNTSAATLITGMPLRPVTEIMPASSDLLWQ